MKTNKVPPVIRDQELYESTLPSYFEGFKDFEWINDCFRRHKTKSLNRIEVGDIDGIVERRGRFIVIETKSMGEKVTGGQLILFKQLYAVGNFTILFLFGCDTETPEYAIWEDERFSLYHGRKYPLITCHREKIDMERLQRLVDKWIEYTESFSIDPDALERLNKVNDIESVGAPPCS